MNISERVRAVLKEYSPSERTLAQNKERHWTKTGNKYIIALNPRWVVQWYGKSADKIIENRDEPIKVIAWISEEEETGEPILLVFPHKRDLEEVLTEEKEEDLVEVSQLYRMGRAWYLPLPEEWLDDVFDWAKDDDIAMISNGLLGAGRYMGTIKSDVGDAIHSVVTGGSR